MSVDLSHIEALLFDLGGVVIEIDFSRVTDTWAQRASSEPSLIASRFSMDEPYRQHEVGLIDGTAYFASLRESLAIDISDQDFLDGWRAAHVGLMDGIQDILPVARNSWPLFGFTNSNPSHHEAVVVRLPKCLVISTRCLSHRQSVSANRTARPSNTLPNKSTSTWNGFCSLTTRQRMSSAPKSVACLQFSSATPTTSVQRCS